MGQPIFAAARDARAHGSGSEPDDPPAGPLALLTLRKRAGPIQTEGAGSPPGNWLFLKGDEPASSTIKRPVLK